MMKVMMGATMMEKKVKDRMVEMTMSCFSTRLIKRMEKREQKKSISSSN